MSKVAIITDIHYGIRQDSVVFLDYFKKFWDNVFFPKLKEENITHVLMLGDLVERRQIINFNTAKRLREDLLEKLRLDSVFHIVGNHDCYYNSSNEVNALRELCIPLGHNVFIEPTEINIDGLDILLLPWINRENYDLTMEKIKTTKAQVCFGHLQIQGFEMYLGQYCEDGLDSKIFDKFELVGSGHFHHKSNKGNIYYLGATAQHTWHDYSDLRGFHIFDTQTRQLEFIKNPYEIFHKIIYDDKDKTKDQVLDWNFEQFENCFIKVYVQNKTNPYFFDLFMEELEKVALDVKKIESRIIIDNDSISNEECQDTVKILQKTVSELPDEINKKELETFLIGLYNQAIQMET